MAPAEQLTRARAYHALGQALCWRLDSAGRRDEAALAEAEECFTRATNLYRALGMRSAVSALAPYWAFMIEFAGGRAQAAMDRLEKALTLVSDRPRRWAYVMCFRAWVAAELGQDDVCQASANEVFRVADQLDSNLFRPRRTGNWRSWRLTGRTPKPPCSTSARPSCTRTRGGGQARATSWPTPPTW